jgi:hypothetical protein
MTVCLTLSNGRVVKESVVTDEAARRRTPAPVARLFKPADPNDYDYIQSSVHRAMYPEMDMAVAL